MGRELSPVAKQLFSVVSCKPPRGSLGTRYIFSLLALVGALSIADSSNPRKYEVPRDSLGYMPDV